MKGTVLAPGIILDADDQRFTYLQEDVASVTKDGAAIVLKQGDEVDFIADGQTAKQIYLTKAKSMNLNLDNINFDIKSNDLSAIRILGLAGSALPILGIIPFIGFIFFIAGFLCMLFAIFKLSDKVGSPTLKKNYILYLVVAVASTILISIGAITGALGFAGMGSGYANAGGTGAIFGVILGLAGVVGMIYAFFKEFQVYNELSNISGDKFFLYYFIGSVVGTITLFIIIGYILLIVAFVLQIVAWYRLQEVKTA